jgi:purine-binding chemotaxis protein CheW
MSDSTITETNQYLTFSLGEEHYAIEVSKVKEVLELQPITRVPKTPDFMRGVINVRGGVVPVIELRRKFDMEAVEPTVDTCIIVLEVSLNEESITLGAIADSVQEVIEIPPENIEPAPKIGTRLETDFIDGMGKYKDNFLMILNIDKVFTAEEITAVAESGQSQENE